MAGKRCYLCGGRLKDGRCVDCGLDNTKNERKTYRLNQSKWDHKATHADEETGSREAAKNRESVKGREPAKVRKPVEVREPVKARESAKAYQPVHMAHPAKRMEKKKNPAFSVKKKSTSIGLIITVVIAVAGLATDYISDLRDSYEPAEKASPAANSSPAEEIDPYEFALRELSAEGEEYSIILEPGEYLAGLQLPEGNYQVFLEEGTGSVTVNDFENSIYIWQAMGTEEEYEQVKEWDDVRVYKGAHVEVYGDVRVRLETDCAQMDSLEPGLENPLTQDVLLEAEAQMTVGEDFPEGIYNMESTGEWSNVVYKIPLGTHREDDELNFLNQSKWVSENGLDHVYRNVVLPKGTVICSEDADVLLTPGGQILSEDYDSYYDSYR